MYVGKKRSEEIDGYITKREGKRERNREKEERKKNKERDMRRNISLRSADVICSPVVKGRSVGSVCANSCELTAYIGLPFCCVLASQPLHHVSVFVRLYPHPRVSLYSPHRLCTEIGKASLAIQTRAQKKIVRQTARTRMFVYSQEFDYIRWF